MGSDPPDRPNRSNRFHLLSDSVEISPKRQRTEIFPSLPSKKNTQNNPKFLVISTNDKNQSFSKLSPFAVKKGLDSISTEINSTKLLRDGNLLIQVPSQRIAERFLKAKTLSNVCAINCKLHETLNSVKGTIYAPCLNSVEEKEIIEELKTQGVTGVYKFTRSTKDGIEPTGRIVLTFDMLRLPAAVDVAWYKVKVSPYIPNPMRCKNCQKFGHTNKRCKSNATCYSCSLPPHDPDTCSRTMCANCAGAHTSDDKNCPKFQQLKEILKIKVTEYCSIGEARRLYNSRNISSISNPSSYAGITKSSSNDKKENTSNKKAAQRVQTPSSPLTISLESTENSPRKNYLTNLKNNEPELHFQQAEQPLTSSNLSQALSHRFPISSLNLPSNDLHSDSLPKCNTNRKISNTDCIQNNQFEPTTPLNSSMFSFILNSLPTSNQNSPPPSLSNNTQEQFSEI